MERKRKLRSWARLAGFGALVIALMALTNPAWATLVTDTGTCDVTVPNKNASEVDCTLPGGASAGIVSYIPSSGAQQASGTGVFDPFVRLQNTPSEQGFNTDANVELDAKAGTWTHAIKVNAIPIVDCDGDPATTPTCWELFVDINENNTAKRVSLNNVQIFFTDSNLLSGYTPGSPPTFSSPAGNVTTEEYDFSGDILINDVNQGSGRGDLRYLVPTAGHTWDANTWFVLYSKWGTTTGTAGNFGTGGYSSDGGFEEWKVRKTPNVTITKTADASSVNAGSDIGFTITVTNSGVADATGVTISDSLPGGTGPSPVHWVESPDNPDCSISGSDGSQSLSCGPVTLAAGGGSLSVHVSASTTQDNCGQYNNTATFTSTNAGSGSASASITVNCGALKILKQSTKGTNPLVANAGAEFCYSTSTDCNTTNVTDNGTGDEDSSTIGSVCVGGLAPGTYYINETKAPSGYGDASQSNVAVTVVNGTNCTTSLPDTGATATFTNPPLGEIGVTFKDLGSGETTASIVCKTGSTTVDAVLENGADDPALDDTDETFTNLAPGTYDCQVVIDP